jgi:hypothetical protein
MESGPWKNSCTLLYSISAQCYNLKQHVLLVSKNLVFNTSFNSLF